jgi:hypothetical protein
MTHLLYNPEKALEYASQYCGGGNLCPDGQLSPPAISDDFPFIALHNTDCTHFIAHVLAAGDIKLTSSVKSCASGLMIRAKELVPWLEGECNARPAYVEKLASRYQAKKGDIAVQWELDNNIPVPRHVMMVSGEVSATGAKVYAHSNNRCGDDFVVFDTSKCWFYRILTPWNKTWEVTDPGKRFRLAIRGANVTWIERRQSDGTELCYETKLETKSDGVYVIRRPNEDRVLRFLDFSDPALRTAILNAGPMPSFMILTLQQQAIGAKWNGLAVRKKPNGSFDSLIQPGTGPVKDFTFN